LLCAFLFRPFLFARLGLNTTIRKDISTERAVFQVAAFHQRAGLTLPGWLSILGSYSNHKIDYQRGSKEMPDIDKKEALEQLRKAKGAHIKWRAYAQALVSGVPVSNEKIPIEHTACAFGQWYHGEAKLKLGHLAAYEAIYTPHEMLHEIYKRIFEVINSPDPGGLKKSPSPKNGRDNERLALARSYMEELVGVSETLLLALDILEDEIRELPDA
jgi:hypothetical protein